METTVVKAIDIPDAWFQCVSKLLDVGRKYIVQKGSFEGEIRFEFDNVVVHIEHPYAEPYDLMLPQIPAHLNIPNPVANGYIEDYLPYIMTDYIKYNEQYTYGSRIFAQIKPISDLLRKTPGTNQAILQVGEPADCRLLDPPCLRHIDIKVVENELIFYPYFRSWDLWGGFPANLAALAVLQHTMASDIGVKTGCIIASSKSLHIYGYIEEIAKIRANKK